MNLTLRNSASLRDLRETALLEMLVLKDSPLSLICVICVICGHF
jgi:hypothetical protein